MNLKTIDRIVWWIPFRKLRDFIRYYLSMPVVILDRLYKLDEKIDKIYSNTTLISINNNIDHYNKPLLLFTEYNYQKYTFRASELQDYYAFNYLRSIKRDFFEKESGFFIDIGANDGISGSTSSVFEELGWNGACIEANPHLFKKLIENRNVKCFNVAMSDVNIEKAKFYNIKQNCFLSFLNLGLSENELNNTLNRIRDSLLLSKKLLKDNEEIDLEIIDVKVINFEKLMSNFPNIKHIDFFSLDIEGGEMSVLRSIDFNKYTFSLLTIETNNNREEINNFVCSKGYQIFRETSTDTMFIRK